MLFFLCFIHKSLSWESLSDLIEGSRNFCLLTNRISLSFLLEFSNLAFKFSFKRFLNKLVCFFCCFNLCFFSFNSVLQINEFTLLRFSRIFKIPFILFQSFLHYIFYSIRCSTSCLNVVTRIIEKWVSTQPLWLFEMRYCICLVPYSFWQSGLCLKELMKFDWSIAFETILVTETEKILMTRENLSIAE